MKPAIITLRTAHGRFLTAEDGGGPQFECIHGRPVGLVVADRLEEAAWQTFDLEPIDEHRIALKSSNGYYLCAENGGGGELVANRRSVGAWEAFVVHRLGDGIALQSASGHFVCAELDHSVNVTRLAADGWETFTPSSIDWLEDAPAAAAPRIVGQLGIRDGSFADSRGPIVPVLCHAGDLIGQGLCLGLERITPALDAIAAAGYHGIRSWWTVWPGGPNAFWDSKPAPRWDLTAETQDRTVAILRAGAARGLAWHLAAGGVDSFSDAQCHERFDRLAEVIAAVGPEHIALCEGVNEARDTAGGRGPAAIERFINRVRARHPQLLYALSAYTGHEDRNVLDAWTPHWMAFYIVHGYRGGRTHDKVRHIFSLGYDGEAATVRRLGWQGEPTGPGKWVSATEAQGELDDEALGLMAAMAAITRQAWVYMSSPGVIYRHPETFEQMPGFVSVPRLVRSLPQDVMTYAKVAHGGESWKAIRPLAAMGEVRCDFAMASDGRFALCAYGPGGRYDLQVSRSFAGEVIHPGTGAREPISGHAGDRVRLEFRHGRVIVGRLT